MNRRYNLSQSKFIEKFMMHNQTRTQRIEDYLARLQRGDKPSVLMTQIPLQLVTQQIDTEYPDPAILKDKTRDYCDTILGYRVYRMYRMELPSVCLFAWSSMTEKFHMVGGPESIPNPLLPAKSPRATLSGRRHIEEAIIRETGLESPHPLGDSLVRTALMLDHVPLVFRTLASWAQEEPLNGLPALEVAALGIKVGEGLPDTLRLLRVLRSWPGVLDKMFGEVDRYGLPDGLLGLTLKHTDNFRTF